MSAGDDFDRASGAAKGHARTTIVFCFLAALAEGFDIQSMGVAAPRLGPELGVAGEALGLAFSASVLGLLVGAALFGRVADSVGRKWTLIWSLAAFGVFSIATAHAWDLESLLIIRLLTGLGLGGALPSLIALSAECAPTGREASLVTVMTSGLPFGGAIAGAVAAPWDWRAIFYAGGVAPLAIALVMIFLLPESRKFLIASAGGDKRVNIGRALFSDGRALATLLLWAAFFFTLLVLYLLLNWLPSLMEAKGVSQTDASLISVFFNLGGGVGTIVLGVLLDRGRRWLVVAATYVGMGVGLYWLAVAEPELISAGSAGFLAGAFVIGAQLVLYGLAPGYYAAVMRSTGVGAAVAMGRFGAVIGPLLAAQLLAVGGDAQRVLLAILPIAAVGGAAALLVLSRRTSNEA